MLVLQAAGVPIGQKRARGALRNDAQTRVGLPCPRRLRHGHGQGQRYCGW